MKRKRNNSRQKKNWNSKFAIACYRMKCVIVEAKHGKQVSCKLNGNKLYIRKRIVREKNERPVCRKVHNCIAYTPNKAAAAITTQVKSS